EQPARCSVTESFRAVVDVPGASPISRVQLADGADRLRGAGGIDGGGAGHLLRDGSLREASSGAGATGADRPKLLKGFVGAGLAFREFKEQGEQTRRTVQVCELVRLT